LFEINKQDITLKRRRDNWNRKKDKNALNLMDDKIDTSVISNASSIKLIVPPYMSPQAPDEKGRPIVSMISMINKNKPQCKF
jgi:hypothetical protein